MIFVITFLCQCGIKSVFKTVPLVSKLKINTCQLECHFVACWVIKFLRILYQNETELRSGIITWTSGQKLEHFHGWLKNAWKKFDSKNFKFDSCNQINVTNFFITYPTRNFIRKTEIIFSQKQSHCSRLLVLQEQAGFELLLRLQGLQNNQDIILISSKKVQRVVLI